MEYCKFLTLVLLIYVSSIQYVSSDHCSSAILRYELRPHPNCKQYYICAFGVLYERCCWNGFYYDIHFQRCLLEKYVDCGNRSRGYDHELDFEDEWKVDYEDIHGFGSKETLNDHEVDLSKEDVDEIITINAPDQFFSQNESEHENINNDSKANEREDDQNQEINECDSVEEDTKEIQEEKNQDEEEQGQGKETLAENDELTTDDVIQQDPLESYHIRALEVCPEIDEGQKFQLPHRECNKYYTCEKGYPVENCCPQGNYNHWMWMCDDSHIVTCRDRL